MKYQDCSTQSQIFKISNLLDRLRPIKSTSQLNTLEFNSRSLIKSSSNRLRYQPSWQTIEPLTVDKIKHQNHNLLVFVPKGSAYHLKTESSGEKTKSRMQKFSSTRTSSKLSAFRQNNSATSSFRVKKILGLRENFDKQNRSPAESGQSSARPLLQQSIIVKRSLIITEQIEQQKNAWKKPIIKPDIQKYFVNHTQLNQLQQKFRLAEGKLLSNKNTPRHLGKVKLFSNMASQRVRSSEPRISFLLNAIMSHNPHLIKRIFTQDEDIIKLILNYQGCFRSLSVNSLNMNSKQELIWGQNTSLWPTVLNYALSILFKNKLNSLTIKSLYQILTGLVLQKIQVSDCSEQKLLQIISSIQNSERIIIGQTMDEQYSTINFTQDSLEVKRYILQTVYTQFQPSSEMLSSNFKKSYRTIYIADLYPYYYFLYKKINYSLGVDSVFYLEVQQQTSIIFQISKQTTAFDAKINLRVEQRKEEGIEQYCNESIKSSVGIKIQLNMLPGRYCVRLSDQKENLKEYRFSILMAIISKRDISKCVREES